MDMVAVDVSHFYIEDEPYIYGWCRDQWGIDRNVWKWDNSLTRGVNQFIFDTAEKANAFREKWEPK